MEKGDPFALLVGMQTSAATVESSMEIPQKIKNETALIHFWQFISKKHETLIQKNICTPMFIAV